jgi:hypothetical protein
MGRNGVYISERNIDPLVRNERDGLLVVAKDESPAVRLLSELGPDYAFSAAAPVLLSARPVGSVGAGAANSERRSAGGS